MNAEFAQSLLSTTALRSVLIEWSFVEVRLSESGLRMGSIPERTPPKRTFRIETGYGPSAGIRARRLIGGVNPFLFNNKTSWC